MILAPFIVEGEKYDWLCIQDNQYVVLNCKAIVNILRTDLLSSQFELGSVSFCDNWDEALFGAAAMIIEIWQGHLQFQDLKKWLKLMKYISFLPSFNLKNCCLYWNIFFHCLHVMKACLHFRLKNVIDSSATIQWKRNLIIQQYEVRAHGSNEMGFWKSSCTLITLQICSLTTFWTENFMLYSCFKTQLASVITISTCIIKQHGL